MKFKKLKYNIICLVMVVLVFSVVMLKIFVFDEPVPDSVIITPTPDDDNLHDNNNNDNIYDDDEYEEENMTDKNMPSTKFPLKRLNYCLNKSAKAESYYSDLSFTTRTLVDAFGLSVDTKQYTMGSVGKLKTARFEDITFTADEWASKFAPQNNLAFIYYDGSKTNVWRTPRDNYDMTKANYYTYDYPAEFYYDRLYESSISFPSNGITNCTISSQGNVDTYTIRISNPAICPGTFMRSYYSFSTSGLIFKSVEQVITFNVNANTGYLINFTQKDTFISEYADNPGVELRQELTYIQKFSKYNQSFEIKHPPIPETPQE